MLLNLRYTLSCSLLSLLFLLCSCVSEGSRSAQFCDDTARNIALFTPQEGTQEDWDNAFQQAHDLYASEGMLKAYEKLRGDMDQLAATKLDKMPVDLTREAYALAVYLLYDSLSAKNSAQLTSGYDNVMFTGLVKNHEANAANIVSPQQSIDTLGQKIGMDEMQSKMFAAELFPRCQKLINR